MVHFGFDGVQISQRDQQQLQPIAAYLMRHEHAQLRIEGNTDERGSREYNIALGERRAQGVSELLQQMGVLKNQMVLVSYGEEKPVDFDHTEAAYQKNRRADMRFIHT